MSQAPKETAEGEDSRQIDADDTSGDSYSTVQAARLLGVSDRRVRQLVAEGRLTGRADAAGSCTCPSRRSTKNGPAAPRPPSPPRVRTENTPPPLPVMPTSSPRPSPPPSARSSPASGS